MRKITIFLDVEDLFLPAGLEERLADMLPAEMLWAMTGEDVSERSFVRAWKRFFSSRTRGRATCFMSDRFHKEVLGHV